MSESHNQTVPNATFSPAELTVLAHLYRGEVYRSTVWRTRLAATTNWAVVATGLALSLTFSSPTASPLPLVLVGLLVAVFLCIEARRYRFFDFWRIRAQILHITFLEAAGRRLRRNYGWIFLIQVTCYAGKLLIHPVPIASLGDVWQRAAIGPVPGQLVLLAGLVFHATWVTVAFLTYRSRRGADRERPARPARDSLLELARGS